MQIGRDDLKAINDYIGNKKFLFGDQVCDLFIYLVISNFNLKTH